MHSALANTMLTAAFLCLLRSLPANMANDWTLIQPNLHEAPERRWMDQTAASVCLSFFTSDSQREQLSVDCRKSFIFHNQPISECSAIFRAAGKVEWVVEWKNSQTTYLTMLSSAGDLSKGILP